MNPSEAIRAFQALGARKMMILHRGTFRLGYAPVYDPPLRLEKDLQEAGLLESWIRTSHGQAYFVAGNGHL